MAGKTDNRLPENSERRAASMRHRERTPGRTSRPSSPFPCASRQPSCQTSRRKSLRPPLQGGAHTSIQHVRFLENRDEHRRNVLQKILGLRLIENRGVLFQLVRNLVDDETAAWSEGIIRFLQEPTFLVDM